MSVLGLSRKKHFKSKLQRKESITFLLYISPWILGFLVFTIVPMISSLIYSFKDVNPMTISSGGTWIGFDNYALIFKDKDFLDALKNTFIFAFAKTFLSVFFALLIALLFNSKFWGNKAVRILIYLPAVIPAVASVMVWSRLFDPDSSLFNWLLSLFKIGPIDWYGNPLPTVLFMGTWVSLGPNAIIILAALQGVNTEVLESADVEGAGPIRKLVKIVIPAISPTLFFMTLTGIIGGLQAYAEIALLFERNSQTVTIAWLVYDYVNSFSGNRTMGYACAVAWVLFVIILIFTAIYFWVSKQLGAFGGADDE